MTKRPIQETKFEASGRIVEDLQGHTFDKNDFTKTSKGTYAYGKKMNNDIHI